MRCPICNTDSLEQTREYIEKTKYTPGQLAEYWCTYCQEYYKEEDFIVSSSVDFPSVEPDVSGDSDYWKDAGSLSAAS